MVHVDLCRTVAVYDFISIYHTDPSCCFDLADDETVPAWTSGLRLDEARRRVRGQQRPVRASVADRLREVQRP